MKQEEKDLLVKDICARLPYGVKVKINNINILKLGTHTRVGEYVYDVIEPCKPYLFPLSSMTEEQYNEIITMLGNESVGYQKYDNAFLDMDGYSEVSMISILKGIDWFNKNHFDYRGLIPKGLANDATGLNIY